MRARLAPVLSLLLAVACSNESAPTPQEVAVDIRLDDGHLEITRVYPVREFPIGRNPAHTFLRYELRIADGLAAAGLIPDPRAAHAYQTDGTKDWLEFKQDWGSASLRLPNTRGELVLLDTDDGVNWSRELARTAFDPAMAQTQSLAAPLFLINGKVLGDPVRLHGDLGGDAALDILILSEGYLESDMEHFHRDADAAVQALFSHPDYADFQARFNIWRQDVASTEAGFSDPDIGQNRRTAFNVATSGFVLIPIGGIPRGIARFGSSFGDQSARELGRRAGADTVVVLTNIDGLDWFRGISLGGVTLMPNSGLEDVLPHELGHEFFKLGDEYVVEGQERCLVDFWYHIDPRLWFPNFSTSGTDVPWWDLVRPGTPLPTPDEPAWSDSVGAFEGALHCPNKYRPETTCLMRGWEPDGSIPRMCRVCRREMEKFFGNFGDQGWFWEDDCPEAWRGDGICDSCFGNDPDCAIADDCNHNERCDAAETCASCADDCGACQEPCGDGVCEGYETDATCPADCGCAAETDCSDVAPYGCWCDPECVGAGDCCFDACDVCGAC